jgi:histone deacetylase 6
LRDRPAPASDTYVNEHSLQAALASAGATVAATQAVCAAAVRSAFAFVRPPGHHAEACCMMGFCFVNNVAVAARAAQRMPGIRRGAGFASVSLVPPR